MKKLVDVLGNQYTATSWSSYLPVVDTLNGKMASFVPEGIGIIKSDRDIYKRMEGKRLDQISDEVYQTTRYALLLYFLNPGLRHPLEVKDSLVIWCPHPNKIREYERTNRG